MKQLSLAKAQQGASVTGVVLFIVMLGLLAKLGVGVIPAYVGHYQLSELVAQELQKANSAKQTDKQFLSNLGSQLSINANYDTKPEEVIVFTNKSPGALSVKLVHTEESVFYGNTFIVNRFEKDITAADAAAVK